MHRFPIVLVMVAVAGCAFARGPEPAPQPSRMAGLEAEFLEHPERPAIAALLAAAYIHIGRAADARGVLERARARTPRDPDLAFLLALAEEALGNDGDAREAYRAFLSMAPDARFASHARARLDRLDAALLGRGVAAVLRPEVPPPAPDPRRVAILPLEVVGSSPNVEPLAAAMRELLCADLENVGWLVVADLDTVAALARIVPAPSPGADSLAAAESIGRLLGAGMVIRGRLEMVGEADLRLEAEVISLGPARVASVVAFQEQRNHALVAMMELHLAAFAHVQVGLEQPFSTSRHVGQGSSSELAAWLAFGRGLLAMRDGDFTAAEEFFADARREDGAFRRAGAWGDRARRMASSEEPPGSVAWRAAQVGLQLRLVSALDDGPSSPRDRLVGRLGRRERAVLAELLGLDGAGGGTVLEILLVPGSGGGR